MLFAGDVPLLEAPAYSAASNVGVRGCTATGGSNAPIGGRLPVKRSTSTVVSWPQQPCASDEVPTSRVSTFGLPCTHSALSSSGSCGSYQAPVGSCTTPPRASSVTFAAPRQAPRSLN